MRTYQQRKNTQAGIAIGPILFIVAILAVLAAAIAAGSGSFSSSTSLEAARANAAAIIQIGQNIKLGHDRIIGLGDTTFTNVVINPANTTAAADMFSPNGGGIAPPSNALRSTGGKGWIYPYANFPGFGTASEERLAILQVTSDVCTQVNNRVGIGATPAAIATGDIDANIVSIPGSSFSGRPTGCFESNDATDAGFYFYQVLGTR